MFGNRSKSAPRDPATAENAPAPAVAQPVRASTTGGFAAPTRQPPQRSTALAANSALNAAEQGKLIVGRDIKLAGEINACDTLIVEGIVTADLRDTRTLEVLEGGTFAGSANVDRAEINGSFEGELQVTGLLIITASGQVTGTVHCGELELQRGGIVSGSIEMASLKDGRIGSRSARGNASYKTQDISNFDAE